jgi:hypothetical protein
MSRRLSQFLSLPKFKEGLTMPFTRTPSDDREPLRDLASAWGKVVARRAYGDEGPGLDLDFDSIESLAVDVGRAVTEGAIQEILRKQSQRLGDHQPCPACGQACLVDKQPRTIQVRGGTVAYDEPVCRCPACRRDFFPSAPELAARLARLLAGDLR